MANEHIEKAWLIENVSKTLADIIKKLVYQQYGLEVSALLRWTDVNNQWVYDILIENVDKKQYTLVSEFAYGIVKGIREYLDYEGE